MKILGWVFIGLVAAGFTYVTLTTDNDQLAIIAGLIGAFSWLMFSFFSLEIVIYDANGSEQISRYPAMAAWGLMMAVPNVYVALTGPLELIHNREEMAQEVR